MKITKKKVVLCSIISIILIGGIILAYNLGKSDSPTLAESKPERPINNSFLTLMLEQDDGTYQESTTNTWPSGNYAFNSELSRCENGGELRWDRENGIVELLSNKSDGCYVYFDLYNVVQISNVSTSTTYNSITVTVTTSGGENPVDKYYFSIDGGNSYQESSTPSYTFSNLTMNHEYTIQVYAKDTLGYESNEETIKVTTDNYVNPVVNSVTATNVTNDSITVSVNASGGTNSISRYYYSSNGGSSYTNTTSNTYTFSGLSAGTSYSIRVYVKDTNGVDSNVYTINAETESVTYICNTGTNLATCIKNQYTSQGTNGIYYHTSSLANSAADNSYRYAGANPNNYVCFGSTANTCPSDNLYRIIGVFGSEVKLIKADYTTTTMTGSGGDYYGAYGSTTSSYKGSMNTSNIATYYRNNSNGYDNTWSASRLNTTNLNSSYISYIGTTWSNKIATHTWYVGGHSTFEATPKTFYNAESSGTTYSAKIGLMYVSDYGYAASNSYWTTNMDSYNSAINNNWMYMGLYEWTISRRSSTSGAFGVFYSGNLVSYYVYYAYVVRPSFYLTSSTTYVSGSGSSADPIRIN